MISQLTSAHKHDEEENITIQINVPHLIHIK